MRKILLFSTAFLLFTMPVLMFPQENKPADTQGHHYRLTFATQEVDENGKITNSRTYATTILVNGIPAQIRTGDKMPIPTNEKDIQYIDVGVSIDCRNANEVNGKLSLSVNTEISSVAKTPNNTGAPIIRSNKWAADVLVPLGKSTIIFSSDDLQSKDKLQVELTATRIE